MKSILYFAKKLYTFSGSILIVNLLGMVLVSLLEGLGLILLIPMISVSGIIDMNPEASYIFDVFDTINKFPVSISLPLILSFYITIVVGQSLLQKNLQVRNIKIQIAYINQLRIETYRSLLQSNWDFFIKKRKSDLINSLTSELGRVSGGTNMFLQLITSSIFTIIQIGIAFLLSPSLTICVLICGLFLTLISRGFIKKSKNIGEQTSKIAKSYLSGMTDHFNGIKDIKSNSLEKSRLGWLLKWSKSIEHEQTELIKVQTNSQLFYKIAFASFIAIFIVLSVTWLEATVEQLFLVIVIFSRLWPRFSGIQSNIEKLAGAIPAFNSIIELQEECKNSMEFEIESLQYNNSKPFIIENAIKCKNVSFRYNSNSKNYSIKDINLNIPSNTMTAIVGRSGAGKSTLIDNLMGLNQPEKGEVLIDDKPLTKDNLLQFRKSISYVPQDPFLFNASIKDNLLLINPHASETEIWSSLEFSSAAEFVKRLPDGLETVIGDRGVKLSGGERQRLVLARAILKKPSILILDEATSALDSENEAKIQEAIEKLKGKMTIIVIAHRLSTIKNADQVIVLDKGEIIQQGDFNKLAFDKNGAFGSLLSKQLQLVK